jgi:hypothetical protein
MLHSCSKATERGLMEWTLYISLKLLHFPLKPLHLSVFPMTLLAIVLVVITFASLQQFVFVDVGQ